jgi:glycerophosphoryl diester phosphodiesterase
MDGSNPKARTVGEFMKGTPPWRTDLYTSQGTLMTHAESIQLFKSLGVKMTPELKQPSVNMPFEGNYSQEQYAQQMIDEYKAAGIAPSHVFAQSFYLPDVLYWLKHDPQFGNQAVFLDDRDQVKTFDHNKPETWIPGMKELADKGVKIIAPPMWMLLTMDEGGRIVPSPYAKEAKAAGLEIITWTLERSGLLTDGGGWYYKSISNVTNNPGDMLEVLDILAKDVGIRGIFSDWPATVTYYANCKKLK